MKVLPEHPKNYAILKTNCQLLPERNGDSFLLDICLWVQSNVQPTRLLSFHVRLCLLASNLRYRRRPVTVERHAVLTNKSKVLITTMKKSLRSSVPSDLAAAEEMIVPLRLKLRKSDGFRLMWAGKLKLD